MKTALWAGMAILTFCGPQNALAKTRHGQPVRAAAVTIYEGSVDAKSAARFTALIASQTDKVVGIKIEVEPSTNKDERYYVSAEKNSINITSGNPLDAPVEIVISDGVGTTSAGSLYTVDGFYLIKSGGSHAAGAVSFGAIPVSEATIRLNPNVHLVTKRF